MESWFSARTMFSSNAKLVQTNSVKLSACRRTHATRNECLNLYVIKSYSSYMTVYFALIYDNFFRLANNKGQTALLDRVVSSSKARNHSEQIRQLVNLANRIQCTCAQLAIGKYTYIYIYVCVCACAHYLLLNSTATSEQIDFCH